MMSDYYLWIKAFHIIAVISWMAGLLYLPRLYVYHTEVEVGSDQDKLFQKMEYRLLRYIMNPAMIVSLILGILLIIIVQPFGNGTIWFHIKALMLFFLFAFHGYLAILRKKFASGTNTGTVTHFRLINEVPTLIMIAIVCLAVVKP